MFDYGEKKFRVEEWSPRGLVIDITRTCNERCKHCIVSAGPQHKNTIGIENLLKAIEDASKNQLSSVGFYGGEPFTRKAILYAGAEKTMYEGMTPQIMTNGFWGINQEKTDIVLSELEGICKKNGGIPIYLNISTDEFHTKVPLRSIANIIHRWLERDDINHVQIGLSIGTGKEEQDDIMGRILDDIDGRGRYISCGIILPHLRMPALQKAKICFSDKTIFFPRDVEAGALKERLIIEGIIEEGMFPEQLSTDDLLRLVSINNLSRVVQTTEDRKKNQFQIGRHHKKSIEWSGGYDFKLLGAGEQLLGDDVLVRRVSERRAKANPAIRIHEKHELILLGLDNRFYLAPSQLYYQISPLGENTGRGIEEVIYKVRERHPIARVILEGDYKYTKCVAVNALGYDSPLVEKAVKLAEKGLEYEAMYLLLKNRAVEEEFMKDWDEVTAH